MKRYAPLVLLGLFAIGATFMILGMEKASEAALAPEAKAINRDR